MKIFIIQDLPVLVDDEDFDRLQEYSWAINTVQSSIRRTSTSNGIVVMVPLANEVMRRRECVFDHKDRNWLNNQKENLRECNHSQNMANREKKPNLSSKYKGVSWYKAKNKWAANIRFNRKSLYLGYHETEEGAARAYDKAALEIFKEFAVLNFK